MYGENYGSINEKLERIILVKRNTKTKARYFGHEETP